MRDTFENLFDDCIWVASKDIADAFVDKRLSICIIRTIRCISYWNSFPSIPKFQLCRSFPFCYCSERGVWVIYASVWFTAGLCVAMRRLRSRSRVVGPLRHGVQIPHEISLGKKESACRRSFARYSLLTVFTRRNLTSRWHL